MVQVRTWDLISRVLERLRQSRTSLFNVVPTAMSNYTTSADVNDAVNNAVKTLETKKGYQVIAHPYPNDLPESPSQIV